ncbi:unnamed protein product [Phaeothamnion confervicola]
MPYPVSRLFRRRRQEQETEKKVRQRVEEEAGLTPTSSPRRVLRFNPRVKIVLIPTHHEMPPRQKAACWYTAENITHFRHRALSDSLHWQGLLGGEIGSDATCLSMTYDELMSFELAAYSDDDDEAPLVPDQPSDVHGSGSLCEQADDGDSAVNGGADCNGSDASGDAAPASDLTADTTEIEDPEERHAVRAASIVAQTYRTVLEANHSDKKTEVPLSELQSAPRSAERIAQQNNGGSSGSMLAAVLTSAKAMLVVAGPVTDAANDAIAGATTAAAVTRDGSSCLGKQAGISAATDAVGRKHQRRLHVVLNPW